MARVTRVRSNTYLSSRGYYGTFTGSFYLNIENCTDRVGSPRSDGPFTLTRYKHVPVRINGTRLPGNIPVVDFIPDSWTPGSMEIFHPGMPSVSAALTKALANTNPNRRTVDMPVFLFELADLPGMLKDIGTNLLKSAAKKGRPPKLSDQITYAAGSNLAFQFGWLPLISDIGKMLDFQNIVDKRVTELKRLYSKGGLRRRYNNFSDQEVAQGFATLQTSNFTANANWMIIRKSKVWTTLRWYPADADINGLPVVNRDLHNEARRATLDLGRGLRQDIDAAAVWEAIPFSWLADYFSNVGDLLKARRNQLPVVAKDACVMTSLHSTCDYTNVWASHNLSGRDGHHDYWSKSRYVNASPTPSFSAWLPFLSGNQLSILGSLAVVLLTGGKPGTQL
jgi:hypothetical protein